jgi:chromosome segregation ATPase
MGKTFRFVRPARTYENREAATQIQRAVRGGMQRLRYKILKLQRMLDTSQDQTEAELSAIRKNTERRKEAIRAEMAMERADQLNKSGESTITPEECHRLIDYLRQENRRLREDNKKIFNAIEALKHENERIESANTSSDDSLDSLAAHAGTIIETHKKLLEVIPQYKAAVEEMKAAVNLRDFHIESERKVKRMYLDALSDISDKFEPTMGEDELSDDVIEMCLEVEEIELKKFGVRCVTYDSSYGRRDGADSLQRLKARYDVPDPSEHPLDDEEIDVYTLHTMK